MPDPSLVVSPVWVMVTVLGGLWALFSVALFGLGNSQWGTLLAAGVGGVLLGQVASDMADWRLVLWGDLHLVQATLGAWLLLTMVRLSAKRKPVER